MTRGVVAVAAVGTLLLVSACTDSPNDESLPPTQSPTAFQSVPVPAAGEILAEHDGYVAVTGNCIQFDWAPVQAIALFEPNPPTGFFVQGGNPPQSICGGRFPAAGDPDSTQDNGSVNVRQALHPDARSADACDHISPNRADDDDPVWDYIGEIIDVDAELGGSATLRLQSGVLCINLSVRLDETLTSAFADPEAELRSIALALAVNARATSLRENYSDLPAPSAS